ncbi:exo-rhamnogalacturonan lyase family protein [Pedobacter caeni]|uniref:Uncharacterized protein n=1 Tax=Pedobacter caeni TaxID=288992 RepID=A0A1M5GE29_9SPHI|nr:hypothetical protein [Pedobacter caeni]SHG01722.1 hypothetical protein SAMN04488522_104168 [Pedobacter caeni]
MKKLNLLLLVLFLCMISYSEAIAVEYVPIKVEKHVQGAPITLGIPIPNGALYSPDQVRLLNKKGKEIPSQITEVNNWMPLNNSIKWIWVFFFADADDSYMLEYGKDVKREDFKGDRVIIRNVQPMGSYTEVSTGPLNFKIKKDKGGFFEVVRLDTDKNGFDDKDIIAQGDKDRGSFLDLLDQEGLDPSKAIITRSVIEKGSGPLHGIIRLEGEYLYSRKDNNAAPFVLRIHVYAGKSYVKVLHTLTYTGVPDQHQVQKGEHARIATQSKDIVSEEESNDKGWSKPNDQIAGTGFSLNYKLNGAISYKVGYKDGKWWENPKEKIYEFTEQGTKNTSLFQTGPKPNKVAPVPESSQTTRIEGFSASLSTDKKEQLKTAKASGWMDISDKKWGIGIGIRYFFEEYPKELQVLGATQTATAYLWSPQAGPMSFARDSNAPDDGILGNFAQGLAKTSELVYYFHEASASTASVQQSLNYILDPAVAHASPETYANSKVFGSFSPKGNDFPEYERGMDYKYDWVLFNQNWAPWYGMFEFGDYKNYYINNKWEMWANNEPAQDYMLWMHFMRTGEAKYFNAAQATSRHTMDVDNIHWPKKPVYYGDTNPVLDYLQHKEMPDSTSPYLGIGKRHGDQHWTAVLSAHVWVQGWLADYFLAADHRGLDIARQTADTYIKRIWGDHDLMGRRLYLSVWNMTEVYDATKEEKYLTDLQDRVKHMLYLQNSTEQNNSLVIDRYGYSQVYASQGLRKYYQISGDENVKAALIRHARSVRDNEPVSYFMESYLSSIHSLLLGYEFTKDKTYLNKALERAEVLKTEASPIKFDDSATQKQLAETLLKVSHLPQDPEKEYAEWDVRNALRVFGWTHAYNVPYLLYWLRNEDQKKTAKK